MIHVFDLDGTLLDTFEHHRAAYAVVGVPFDQAVFTSGLRVVCSPEVKAAKNRAFGRAVRHVAPDVGWAWDAFVEAQRQGERVAIVTAASSATVAALAGVHGVLLRVPLVCQADGVAKRRIVAGLVARGDVVVYYDDSPTVGPAVVRGLAGARWVGPSGSVPAES